MCLITTVAVINGSRPCLLNSNLSSYGLPYLIPSFCVKPASCGSHSLQTVVPDELFHFVWNKLALGDQMRNSLFNHYWSRRVLPEVPLSWWGLVSIPLSFPYGKLSVRPDIVIRASKSCTHKVNNTVRTLITYVKISFLFFQHIYYNKNFLKSQIFVKWCLWLGSNQRPFGYEPNALAN